MKTPVAVTLILSGVFVVTVPALWTAWSSLMLAMTLPHLQAGGNVNFGEVSAMYQFGCWGMGAAMVGVAVVASLVRRTGAEG